MYSKPNNSVNSRLQELVLRARGFLDEMRTNLDCIQKELANLNVRQDARHAVAVRCEDFCTYIDLYKESMNSRVADFIETENKQSHERQSLKDLVDLIKAWVNFEIMELYNLAWELATHRQESIDLGILYAIVVKSGDNILNAHKALSETLNAIDKQLS